MNETTKQCEQCQAPAIVIIRWTTSQGPSTVYACEQCGKKFWGMCKGAVPALLMNSPIFLSLE